MTLFNHLCRRPAPALSISINRHAREPHRGHAVFLMPVLATLLLVLMTLQATASHAQSKSTTVANLAKTTHFHGLVVDKSQPELLLLATHDGIYHVSGDGKAKRLSQNRDDFMGFAAHPTNPSFLVGSGHPVGGGNLGFITSQDVGRTWEKRSDGVGGPVDFHQLVISPADPKVIYGVFRGIQRSTDGGESWRRVGDAPEGLITLAASSLRASWLFAATQNGIQRSGDGGRNWRTSYASGAPATLIHVTPEGVIYAYVVGLGFIKSHERDRVWKTLNGGFGASYLVGLAVDPTNPTKLSAIAFDSRAKTPAIWESSDGGSSWSGLGGNAIK